MLKLTPDPAELQTLTQVGTIIRVVYPSDDSEKTDTEYLCKIVSMSTLNRPQRINKITCDSSNCVKLHVDTLKYCAPNTFQYEAYTGGDRRWEFFAHSNQFYGDDLPQEVGNTTVPWTWHTHPDIDVHTQQKLTMDSLKARATPAGTSRQAATTTATNPSAAGTSTQSKRFKSTPATSEGMSDSVGRAPGPGNRSGVLATGCSMAVASDDTEGDVTQEARKTLKRLVAESKRDHINYLCAANCHLERGATPLEGVIRPWEDVNDQRGNTEYDYAKIYTSRTVKGDILNDRTTLLCKGCGKLKGVLVSYKYSNRMCRVCFQTTFTARAAECAKDNICKDCGNTKPQSPLQNLPFLAKLVGSLNDILGVKVTVETERPVQGLMLDMHVTVSVNGRTEVMFLIEVDTNQHKGVDDDTYDRTTKYANAFERTSCNKVVIRFSQSGNFVASCDKNGATTEMCYDTDEARRTARAARSKVMPTETRYELLRDWMIDAIVFRSKYPKVCVLFLCYDANSPCYTGLRKGNVTTRRQFSPACVGNTHLFPKPTPEDECADWACTPSPESIRRGWTPPIEERTTREQVFGRGFDAKTPLYR